MVFGGQPVILALALEPADLQDLEVGERLNLDGLFRRRHKDDAFVERVFVAVRRERHLALQDDEDMVALLRGERQ